MKRVYLLLIVLFCRMVSAQNIIEKCDHISFDILLNSISISDSFFSMDSLIIKEIDILVYKNKYLCDPSVNIKDLDKMIVKLDLYFADFCFSEGVRNSAKVRFKVQLSLKTISTLSEDSVKYSLKYSNRKLRRIYSKMLKKKKIISSVSLVLKNVKNELIFNYKIKRQVYF